MDKRCLNLPGWTKFFRLNKRIRAAATDLATVICVSVHGQNARPTDKLKPGVPTARLARQPVNPAPKKTIRIARFMPAALGMACLLGVLMAGGRSAAADAPATNSTPPASWVDPDTGHRISRLTREPGSDSFYFNVNGYTPDGKRMAYTTTNGISVLNLETLEAKRLITGKARPIVVAHHSANLYYTRPTTNRLYSTLWCVNLDTGDNRKLANLPAAPAFPRSMPMKPSVPAPSSRAMPAPAAPMTVPPIWARCQTSTSANPPTRVK